MARGHWIAARMAGVRAALNVGPDQIVALQFLRGLAASLVVVQHLFERYARRGALPADLPDFVARLGETGVFAFFAISGFIMVHITQRDAARAPSGASFLRARYLRVAPLYYLTTLLMFAFTVATHGLSTNDTLRIPALSEWISSFLFLPQRGDNGLIQPVYLLGWSLNYEMFFYLLFAAGLGLSRQRGVWIVTGALASLVFAGQWVTAPAQSWGIMMIAYAFTRPILLYFILGIAIALLRNQLRHRQPDHTALPALPLWTIAVIAVGLLLIAAQIADAAATLAVIGLAVATCVLIRPVKPTQQTPFTVFSSAFGNASYSIYLTHSFLLGAFALLTSRWAGQSDGLLILCALIASAGSLILGWLTWHYVEVPMTRALRNTVR